MRTATAPLRKLFDRTRLASPEQQSGSIVAAPPGVTTQPLPSHTSASGPTNSSAPASKVLHFSISSSGTALAAKKPPLPAGAAAGAPHSAAAAGAALHQRGRRSSSGSGSSVAVKLPRLSSQGGEAGAGGAPTLDTNLLYSPSNSSEAEGGGQQWSARAARRPGLDVWALRGVGGAPRPSGQ